MMEGAPAREPELHFMGYGQDSCMNMMFTQGRADRMSDAPAAVPGGRRQR